MELKSLILTRKRGEVIVITDTRTNEKIYIKALHSKCLRCESTNNIARLLISANEFITVNRLEIQLQKDAQQQEDKKNV
jgi:sRNA-binding carbon storage regulator CsrA